MNNETTRLINDEPISKGQTTSESQSQPNMAKYVKTKKRNSFAAATGGFVAGVAAGAAATATASNNHNDTEIEADNQTADIIEVEPEAPAPEQAILANDEGIRYAHVEADNFSDAFAQARQQVGPGGVFEYNGNIYSTYIAEEWDAMTPQERAEYQGKIFDYVPKVETSSSAASAPEANANPTTAEEPTIVAEPQPEEISANPELISDEPVDSEIRVLGVEAVQNEDGQIMNVALLECEGDQALLVDVDNNGTIDVLIHDDNGDGQIQDSEAHDISDAGLEITDLMEAQAAQDGDMLYASNDDMPDYVNDADSIMTI